MLCGPIDDGGDDDGGDDDLVPLSSMSIRYVLLYNQVEYFVRNVIFLFAINRDCDAEEVCCNNLFLKINVLFLNPPFVSSSQL